MRGCLRLFSSSTPTNRSVLTLLATPIILAAMCAAGAAGFAVHYPMRYSKTRTFVPFGIDGVLFGLTMVLSTTA
jgi:hypothetical protein